MKTQPRVLILRCPGTNCDLETATAFERAGAACDRLHVNALIDNPTVAERYQILCLPGGFSYGDDIAAGAILATRLRHRLGDLLRHFIDGDHLVLGICNGMQVMMRLGLLTADVPVAVAAGMDTEPSSATLPPATLTWNRHGRFEDRWVNLSVDPRHQSVFFRGVERMFLPIAHAEGRFVARDNETLTAMADAGRLPLLYGDSVPAAGDPPLAFPDNPNGGDGNVAAVCDATGRVMGMMPHPERHVDPLHHPAWTRRREQPEHGDGMVVFQNAVDYFAR